MDRKRIGSMVLAASMALSVSALAAQVSPVEAARQMTGERPAQVTAYQASDWAKEELSLAQESNLIPEALAEDNLAETISRQDFAAAAVTLYRQIMGEESASTVDAAPFTDCQDPAVGEAHRLGLVTGVGNGKFDPDGILTREQAATIFQRIVSLSQVKLGLCGTPFANMSDVDVISSWARDGASMMANMGIIQGKPDASGGVCFDPRGTLTGQEALVMSQRLAQEIENLRQDEATGVNTFASDLFAAVESEDGPNKSISSVSAQYALGLLQAGAQGETLAQLDNALRGIDFDLWNQVLSTKSGGPVVEVANSLWFSTSVTPSDTYQEVVKDQFDAQSQSLDLTARSALNTINAWVREKTHDLIQSILDQPLGEDAAAVLLNALYFKGDWAYPFDGHDTYDQTFTNSDGTEVKVPFMHDTRHGMQIIETETCVGVALPYEGGEADLPQGADPSAAYPANNGWWMIALLPKEGVDAADLAAENFTGLLGNAQDRYVRLSLPKFTIEGSYDLTQPLKDLGLTGMFQGGDLNGIATSEKGPVAVSKVIQKTYLRVDEEGTEAAAVTGAVMETTSALEPEEPMYLSFNRSFLCCLWNDTIGQPLFLTAVNELE